MTDASARKKWIAPTFVRAALQHLGVIGLALALWWGVIVAFDIGKSVLPAPMTVLGSLFNQFTSERFWLHVGVTSQEIVLGFSLGCGIAFVLGVLVAQNRIVERTLYPIVIAFESVPKIALAPLFVVWFGFGLTSKVVTTAVICFFPMFINVTRGMLASSVQEVEMMKSAGAGRLSLLWRLRLPNAMPMIFSALSICVILAIVGAVVAEYVGASAGLGYQLLVFSRQIRTADVFANIIVLSLMGLLGSYVIKRLQRRFVFWSEA